MKALFVTTETNEIPKYAESFESVNGNESKTFKFFHRSKGNPHKSPDLEIQQHVEGYKPDMLVYVGACRGNMPSIDCFATLNKRIPTVILISDAADKPWWPILIDYDDAQAFRVMVAIDGNKNWPFHAKHITCLTPIDPKRFAPKPHSDREIAFGFAGNTGGLFRNKLDVLEGRKIFIEDMQKLGLYTCPRDKKDSFSPDTYKFFAQFMCNTRMTPNFPRTGSYETMHVKGRVVEAGLAGTMLIEQKGSPTSDWFTPGEDYLEWELVNDVKAIVRTTSPDQSEAMGNRLREKILENHSPEKFWGRITERLS